MRKNIARQLLYDTPRRMLQERLALLSRITWRAIRGGTRSVAACTLQVAAWHPTGGSVAPSLWQRGTLSVAAWHPTGSSVAPSRWQRGTISLSVAGWHNPGGSVAPSRIIYNRIWDELIAFL